MNAADATPPQKSLADRLRPTANVHVLEHGHSYAGMNSQNWSRTSCGIFLADGKRYAAGEERYIYGQADKDIIPPPPLQQLHTHKHTHIHIHKTHAPISHPPPPPHHHHPSLDAQLNTSKDRRTKNKNMRFLTNAQMKKMRL